MREVFVIDATRTAVGNFMGSLSSFKASELGSHLIKNIISKHNLAPDSIDEVILGQVLASAQGQNPARQASINAGIDIKTPAYTINKVCGSGLKSIALAYDAIALGHSELVIAGGQESMSNAPHASLLRKAVKMGNAEMIDTMMQDGLVDAFSNVAMGITAENISKKYNILRDEQDEFALNSQLKASDAIKNGFFKSQIVPVEIKSKKETISFDSDEFVRHDSSKESLAKLRPAFDQNGTVTAGNSSGINDGAAVLLLASEDAVRKFNLKPIAKIINHASAGVDPQIMGIGPAEAVSKLIKKVNWNINDLDLVESNEAFAAQAIAVNKLLNWDTSKVNVTGGAIAIGHPIGASGVRISVTLLHNLKRLGKKKGLACLCIGGGMGIAMCFENLA
jgi:acetyl-CoA C-acetyltransferase